MRRALASLLTLGLLGVFLFTIVLGLMVFFGAVNVGAAIALVVALNLLVLALGPRLNDFIYGFLYDVEWVTLSEFRQRSPASADVIEEVTAEHGYTVPKLGVIPDRNPTAFTYGSGRFNGRVVVTEGCFEFLDDEEVAAVVAHELGHVTSRDFVIMTIANTIVQVLYLIAVYAFRFAGGGRGRSAAPLFVVGALAYVFWFVGEFAVLFLSRVREYAADGFAAEYTHPDHLSKALVKIAYGFLLSGESPELEQATRNLGIMNVEQSKDEGVVYHNSREAGDFDALMRSFQFDLENPWARLSELRSTHPLTGKRVRRLSRMEGASRFDFEDIRERYPVDRSRLYREFVRDVAVLALPVGLAVLFPLGYFGAVVLADWPLSLSVLAGGWLLAIAVGLAAKAHYRYPLGGEPETVTVAGLLGDMYASPVDGRLVALDGELIGRGQAGFNLGSDVMFRDETGLMYIQYESWVPVLGNLFFAVARVPELVGEAVEIEGWYLRSTTPWVGMRRLATDDDAFGGYVHVGGYVLAALLAVGGVIVLALGAVL